MCVCVQSRFSRVQLFMTLWTVAFQAPLSMGFPGQEDWSGLPSPPPGESSWPSILPTSLTHPASAGGFYTPSTTWEAHNTISPLPRACLPRGSSQNPGKWLWGVGLTVQRPSQRQQSTWIQGEHGERVGMGSPEKQPHEDQQDGIHISIIPTMKPVLYHG